MTAPLTTVKLFTGAATGGNVITLNDPVRGLLGSSTYLLGGDAGTDLGSAFNSAHFDRGRTAQIYDVIDPATGSLQLNNEDRAFDPFNTAGPYYGNLKPGKRVQISTLGVTTFDCKVRDWMGNYQVSGRSIAIVALEDGLATLGRQQFSDWTATAGQTAGPRLTDILNRTEVAWSGGARNIQTGVSTLQGDNVSAGSSVLNYAQLVAKSDLGVLYVDRKGVLTFKDRHDTIGASSVVTFADDGSGFYFTGVGTTFGWESFFTRVSVDREGGIAQSSTSSVSTTDGIRSLSISGLLQDSDAQALSMAQYLANIYSTGEARVSEITVNLNYDQLTETQMVSILSLDINDVVTVKWTPNQVGAQIVQQLVIQGLSVDIGAQWHQITFHLGKLDQRTPFTLNDPVLGVLGGPGVLSF